MSISVTYAPRWDAATAGEPVNLFSTAMLPKTELWTEFLDTVRGKTETDIRFLHAPATRVRIGSDSLRQGVNWFGHPSPKLQQHFGTGVYNMRHTESVVLHRAIYSPRSASIARLGWGVYEESVQPHVLAGRPLQGLADVDPLYRTDEQGRCFFGEEASRLEYSDEIAVPVCGLGYPNYGHFLYDGLPVVLMLKSLLDRPRFSIIGPPRLAAWQREILAGLNLLDRYRPLEQPTTFRKIVASTLMSLHVSYPTRFVRPVFDLLRFRFGGERQEGRMLFVSRAFDTDKRVLTNRAEVEALFRSEGFEIVYPEQLSIAEQVRLFASAAVVAGESGAGLANIGFCEPGAKVLEIQPEQFFEGWTRAACTVFGHRWYVYCAAAPADSAANAIESLVDLAEMQKAIRAVIAA